MRARQFRFLTVLAFVTITAMAATSFAQFGHPLKGTWIGDWGPNKDTQTHVVVELHWDGKAVTGSINPGANGTWHIAGGTNVVTTVFDIADSLTATGTVRMTGGQLSTPSIYIGLFGNGSMLVSNGIFQCAGQVLVASQPGARGNFTATGGTSTFGSMLISESSTATGAVLVAGSALVQVNGELDNRGVVTVAGGSLNVLGQLESIAPKNAISVTAEMWKVSNPPFATIPRCRLPDSFSLRQWRKPTPPKQRKTGTRTSPNAPPSSDVTIWMPSRAKKTE